MYQRAPVTEISRQTIRYLVGDHVNTRVNRQYGRCFPWYEAVKLRHKYSPRMVFFKHWLHFGLIIKKKICLRNYLHLSRGENVVWFWYAGSCGAGDQRMQDGSVYDWLYCETARGTEDTMCYDRANYPERNKRYRGDRFSLFHNGRIAACVALIICRSVTSLYTNGCSVSLTFVPDQIVVSRSKVLSAVPAILRPVISITRINERW